MNQIVPQAIGAALASVLVWIIKLTFAAVRSKNKLDSIYTQDARDGISKCKAVLKLVGSSGGKSEHPWQTEQGIIREDEIRDYLDRFANRVKSRKISNILEGLKSDFRTIFASSVWHTPLVIFGDGEIFDGKSDLDREEDNKKAARQLAAFDSARARIQEIEPLLGKIERKSSK